MLMNCRIVRGLTLNQVGPYRLLRARVRKLAVLAAITAAGLLSSRSANANITFVTTFDPSFASNFGANTAAAEAAFLFAESQYTANFADNITVNLTVIGDPGATFASTSPNYQGVTYAALRAALISHATTANDTTSLQEVPASNPLQTSNYLIGTPEAKALGLAPAAGAGNDGNITFGAAFNWTFGLTPATRAVPGAYDFVGSAEHEISEAMGRLAGLGQVIIAFQDNTAYDLFRYKGTNTRSLADEAGAYFSIDNGVTHLKNFNFTNGNGSDPQDWAAGTPDSYNAFALPGQMNDLSSADFTAMDVLGFAYSPVPEPASLGLIGLLAPGMLWRRRRA